MKVVIDTSVLVSAVLKDRDPEAVILFAAGRDDIEWIVSPEIMAEYRDVLSRPKLNPRDMHPMTTFDEVSSALHQHLDELKQSYAVAEIGIFGSFARGEQGAGSDVDVLVEFSRPVGFVAFIQLENRLQEILGRKVDLVTRKALKPHIGRRILDEVRYVQ